MAILTDGLNQKVPFVGDLSSKQETSKKMTAEEYAKFEKERDHLVQKGGVKEFPDLMSTMYTDTAMLCKIIGSVFRPVFNDYYGAKIDIVQGTGLYISVFFSPNPTGGAAGEGKINALESIIDKNDRSSDNLIQAINHMSTFGHSSTLKLSKKADEILRDVIPNGAINHCNGKIDWNKLLKEGSLREQNGFTYSNNRPYLQVMCDTNKLLKCIFGDRTTDGGRWEYMINVGNPINPTPNAFGEISSSVWQLFVMRCNSKDVQDMAESLGLIFGSNDLNIITT